MKNITQITLFLFGSIFLGHTQSAQKNQNFDASIEVGIFYYEEDKAIQKIKIKQKEVRYSVKKEIIAYNSKIKEISFLKNAELNEVTTIVSSVKKVTDRTILEGLRTRIHSVMTPIKDSIKGFQNRLNTNLKKQLSNKQFKNWIKYQRRRKREMAPKAPEVQRSNPPPTRRNMGQRRRRY